MIRYPVTRAQLKADIDALEPDWRQRAEDRTQKLEALGCWSDEFAAGEPKVSWSEVKKVYRDLQHDKCAYCERRLDGDPDLPTIGSQEHDLEHFRPKSKTIAWRRRSLFPDQQVSFPKSMGRKEGYHWLAFELWNWCTSCKRCNSQLKGNRFPISTQGTTGAPTDEVSTLQTSERPLLIYPLGEIDEDPEDLLGFRGVVVHPKHPSGHKHQRAKATIAFFLLNTRGLIRRRALWLKLAWNHLCKEFAGDADARAEVDRWLSSSKVEYAGAVRAFIRLARRDRAAAEAIMPGIEELVAGFV